MTRQAVWSLVELIGTEGTTEYILDMCNKSKRKTEKHMFVTALKFISDHAKRNHVLLERLEDVDPEISNTAQVLASSVGGIEITQKLHSKQKSARYDAQSLWVWRNRYRNLNLQTD